MRLALVAAAVHAASVCAEGAYVAREGQKCNLSLPPELATKCADGLECISNGNGNGAPGICKKETKSVSPAPVAHGPSTEYMHAKYNFDLDRMNMKRKGEGELWFAFNRQGWPQLRLRGAARSPRFGDGEITIVADSSRKKLYALFKLGELHEAQCVVYAFPKPELHQKRLESLRARERQVLEWLAQSQEQRHLALNWSGAYKVEFLLSDNGQEVQDVNLRHGERVIKTVHLQKVVDAAPQEVLDFFTPPAAKCKDADLVTDPLAKVEFRPPHQRSSALNDVLLVMGAYTQDSPHTWSKLFVLLSACTVPGDVAVLIEDPAPPQFDKLSGLSFDYTTQIIKLGGNLSFSDPAADISDHVEHTSHGSIWFNLLEKAFRYRDSQAQTKVGPVLIDLIAKGAAPAGGELYAHVNLTVQRQSQCLIYDYPSTNATDIAPLQLVASQGLSFFAVSQLGGEDCGIFVAPLPRGRWIHVWVDMESDRPHEILRSEVRKGGQVLRRTDVMRWRIDEEARQKSLLPSETWGCVRHWMGTQFAHLGLREVQSWSAELMDALHAVRSLPREFAVLEVLALAGDVNLMVEEPGLPELWRLPALSFGFSVYLWSTARSYDDSTRAYVDGSFVSDQRFGWVALRASLMQPGATNLSLILGPKTLFVQVREAGAAAAECLTLPLGAESDTSTGPEVGIGIAEGTFDGVENIGDFRCNRFTFPRAGPRNASVKFWYSEEEDSVCQLQMLPASRPDGGETAGTGVLIYVPMWQHISKLADYGALIDEANFPASRKTPDKPSDQSPPGWNCKPAVGQGAPWAHILPPGTPQYTLIHSTNVCAEDTQISRLAGPAADSVHGCFEECVTRPKCSYFAFRPHIDCRVYRSPCLQIAEAEPYSLYSRRYVGDIPTAHAIAKLAEAASVVGLLQASAASALSRLVVTPPSFKERYPSEPLPMARPALSVLSPDLRHFSFSFTSEHTALGPEGGAQAQGSARGELKVDLVERKLYVKSIVANVSSGIAHAESEVVFSGAEGHFFVRTRMDSQKFLQCWSLQMLLGDTHGPPWNPFLRGRRASSQSSLYDFSIPGPNTALLSFKVGRTSPVLEELRFDGSRGSTRVLVSDWSTEPIAPDIFQAGPKQTCPRVNHIPASSQMSLWHLINIFLPRTVQPAAAPVPEARLV